MVTDTDLIGIIAASCIMLSFIIGLTALLAVKCYKRMERIKRERIAKNGTQSQQQLEAAEYVPEFHSIGSLSENPSHVPSRMSTHRPKILREEEETSTKIPYEDEETSSDEHSSRDSSEVRKYRKWRHKERRQSRNKNGHSEFKRAVSVIHVNSSEISKTNGHLRREVKVSEHLTEGFITLSHGNGQVAQGLSQHDRNELLPGHAQQQRYVQNVQNEQRYAQNVQNEQRYVQNEIRLQTGNDAMSQYESAKPGHVHRISSNAGDGVRGYIIKQNVAMEADGKLVITSSEHRDFTEVVHEHKSQNDEIHSLATPSDVEIILEHITSSNVAKDDNITQALMNLDKREDKEWITDEIETIHTSGFSVEQTHPETVIRNVSDNNNQNDNSWNILHSVTKTERKEVHDRGTTEDRYADSWVSDEEDHVDRFDKRQLTPEIVVNDHHEAKTQLDGSATETQTSSSLNVESEQVSGQTWEIEDFAAKRQDDSISVFYSDSKNYKVIKKHSAHKPPDWLVQTYAESAASVDLPQGQVESSNQAVQTVETALVTTSSQSYHKEGQKVSFDEVTTDIHNERRTSGEDSITYPEPDYPEDEETYTITDYVDPESGAVGRAVSRMYSGAQTSEDGTITTTKSMTATTMREMRQHVNETREKTSPALRRARAPWEMQEAEGTSVESEGGLAVMTVQKRKQSIEIISVGDTPLGIVELVS